MKTTRAEKLCRRRVGRRLKSKEVLGRIKKDVNSFAMRARSKCRRPGQADGAREEVGFHETAVQVQKYEINVSAMWQGMGYHSGQELS